MNSINRSNQTRASSLPPDLLVTHQTKTKLKHVATASVATTPRINRVKPVVQPQPLAVERLFLGEERGQSEAWWRQSEASLGVDQLLLGSDNKSILTGNETLHGYKIHPKTVLANEYKIAFDDYREASDSFCDDSNEDSDDSYEDDHRPRRSHHHWQNRYDFVSSQLVYNSHFNILWRLPYMSLTCGGGAFLVIVIILSFMFGLPILIIESSIGQLTRSGPVRAMERVCSLAQGLGIAMSVLAFLTTVYYSVLTAWALKLLVTSANVPLLWKSCSKVWNDNDTCVPSGQSSLRLKNKFQEHQLFGVVPAINLQNYFEDSTIEQYFYKRFLDQDHSSWESFMTIRGEIAACLFVVWLGTYFCIWKRRKTSQWSRQLQMIILYAFLVLPFVMFTMENSGLQSLTHLLYPKSEDFKNVTVWCCGLGYVCNLFGLGFGVPMELAASNTFNYRNLIKDGIIVVIISIIMTVFVCVIVMLHSHIIASNKGIAVNDLGYTIEAVFLIFMDGFSDSTLAQFYLIMFFSIFSIIGFSTILFQLDLVISAIQDNFWASLNKYLKSREVLAGNQTMHLN